MTSINYAENIFRRNYVVYDGSESQPFRTTVNDKLIEVGRKRPTLQTRQPFRYCHYLLYFHSFLSVETHTLGMK